jgi:hypothetical protein
VSYPCFSREAGYAFDYHLIGLSMAIPYYSIIEQFNNDLSVAIVQTGFPRNSPPQTIYPTKSGAAFDATSAEETGTP